MHEFEVCWSWHNMRRVYDWVEVIFRSWHNMCRVYDWVEVIFTAGECSSSQKKCNNDKCVESYDRCRKLHYILNRLTSITAKHNYALSQWLGQTSWCITITDSNPRAKSIEVSQLLTVVLEPSLLKYYNYWL